MSRGFVTLAVGSEKYYILAYNLLLSYRKAGGKEAFAIYCDRENHYTKEFNKVIILSSPYYSYLDKIQILNFPAYKYNIFIDADSLVYKNIDCLFCYFPFDGVKCFGSKLPIHSNDGWFNIKNLGNYSKTIKYLVNHHGGIIFYTNDYKTKNIYETSVEIARNYSKYKFRMFENPADEPIMALSMAIHDSCPIELENSIFLFLPMAKSIKSNISRKYIGFSLHNNDWNENALLIHFQNYNTLRARYKTEINRLNSMPFFYIGLLDCIYKIKDYVKDSIYNIKVFIYNIIH